MSASPASPVILLVAVLSALVPPAGGAPETIPDLYSPGDEATWVFEAAGQRIGENWFRYDGVVELALGTRAHRFTSQVRLTSRGPAGELRQRHHSELWTDDRGRLLRHRLEVELGQTYSSVDVTVSRGEARVRIVQGSGSRELTVPVQDAVFAQANNLIGTFELLLGLHPPRQDAPLQCRLFSSNAVQELPYTATWTGAIEPTGDRPAGVTARDSFGEVLTLSDEGRLLRLEVPSQKLVIRRTNEPFESFTLKLPVSDRVPRRGTSEEVAIEHGAVSLAGTITGPEGARGPLPAVFFISGSGLQDRDGFAGGIDLGTHEILDRLTEEGFLVLRVDDRGAGASKGPMARLGYDDLIADARACVEFLKGREDVVRGKIALIGHSEGGVTAPILAAEDSSLGAIVLMASIGRPLIEVMYDQNVAAIEKQGLTGKERDELLADVRKLFDLLVSDEPIDPSILREEFRSSLGLRPWLQGHAKRDPIETLRKVRCPILILQGARDFQVSPEKDARALEKALQEIEHPDFELHIFPGLDHLFKKTAGEESTLAEYLTRRPVDPGFLDVLVVWLKERLLD